MEYLIPLQNGAQTKQCKGKPNAIGDSGLLNIFRRSYSFSFQWIDKCYVFLPVISSGQRQQFVREDLPLARVLVQRAVQPGPLLKHGLLVFAVKAIKSVDSQLAEP